MKKITLLFALLFGICMAGQGFAMTVNISGTITDISNGAPVPGHTVYILSDSSSGSGFFYYNNVLTNSTGFYAVSILNVNPNDSVIFTVKTQDCTSSWIIQTVQGNTTPVTADFQICTGTPPALTVTISGTIYEAGTVFTVPNHAVSIFADSSSGFFYANTVYTNSLGYYSVTISNVPANTVFDVSTLDCNNISHMQVVNSSNVPGAVNFYICVSPPPPTGSMWGQIYTGNTFADYARVDLILSVNDSLIVIDSYFIGDSMGMYNFPAVAPGNYILMAELLENSVYYGQYLPTYYVASNYWTGATLIQQTATPNQYDIHLVAVSGYAPGSGNITGNIQQGLKSSSGTPVSNMEVMLLDQNNQPLAFTTTDVSGNFIFPNIAFGTYVVYPQKLAVNTIPATVTLTSNNPNSNLLFFIDNGTIITGTGNRLASFMAGELNIYPNPVMDKGVVELTASRDTELSLVTFDMSGKMMTEKLVNVSTGENRIDFSASSLINGIYYMKLTAPDGSSVVKQFIVGKQ